MRPKYMCNHSCQGFEHSGIESSGICMSGIYLQTVTRIHFPQSPSHICMYLSNRVINMLFLCNVWNNF